MYALQAENKDLAAQQKPPKAMAKVEENSCPKTFDAMFAVDEFTKGWQSPEQRGVLTSSH